MHPALKPKLKRTEIWNPSFEQIFKGFDCLLPLWQDIKSSFTSWPTIEQYNQLARTLNLDFQFILQQSDTQYEAEIYLHNRVPMRPSNWHDFFNNLTWLIFPNMKRALIEVAQHAAHSDKPKQRTPKQNVLAHFDECGIVICSDDKTIFNQIKNFEWKNLFWENKQRLIQHCHPVITGHGILEKGLTPYIGMTAKALFLTVPNDYFTYSALDKLKYVDTGIAQIILSNHFPDDPKALSPFPVLGLPEWHLENSNEVFFENENYFRRKRNL
jgi:hypothetical protein